MNDQPANSGNTFFRTAVEVRWGDMDAFNHVNNTRYLTYLEQARLAWLAKLDKQTWMGQHSAPIMAATQLNYRKPITWPDCTRVAVEMRCDRLGTSSVTVGHRIVDAARPDTLYCDGNVVLVWVDPATGKSVPLPEVIRAAAQAAA